MKVLDLAQYRSPNSKVFSGRARGERVRTEENLDRFDNSDEKIIVKIPDDVFSFNTSFFLGLFGKSVRSAGSREEFRRKFIFQSPDYLEVDIEGGIADALRNSTPL